MEKEKEKVINNKKTSTQVIENTNFNNEELINQINALKEELKSKNDLLNNLIQEKNKQNLILKDFDILKQEKNQINTQINQMKEELENFKSINNKMNYEIEQLKLEKDEHIKTIEKLNLQINSDKNALIDLNNKISHNDIVQNTNNDLIKKMVSLQDILSMKEAEIISLKKLNNELSQTNTILSKQNNDYKIIFNQQENNHNEINQKIESYNLKISELLKMNKNCELMRDDKIMKDSLKQIKMENNSLSKEINEQAKNISLNEKSKEDLEIKNKNYEIEIQKHLQKITTQSQEQLSLEENIKNLNIKITKYENDIMDIKSMLIKQQELNSTINNEKNNLINTNENLRKELNKISVEYDNLRSTNKKLQEENIKSLNTNIENLLSENKKLQNERW